MVDVNAIQTILILASGLVLAYLSITRPEVGGLLELFAKEERRVDGLSKMSLYLPPNHPTLPWTGALSGLFLLHTFYWNTNQYVVQRTLGGKSLREARYGILVGGLLKLTVPFFSILTGIAAYQIWSSLGETANVAPDEAFSKLVVLVVPVGYGLIGVILAGLLGAIFSSIDSMLHSAATLFTIDFYKPLMEKKGILLSDEREMKSGRIFLLFFSFLVTLFAIILIDPNSKKNFFIELSNQSSHFTPALLVVFLLGIFNFQIKTSIICFVILFTPILSLSSPFLYTQFIPSNIKHIFGEELNFLHRVFLIFHFALVFLIIAGYVQNRIKSNKVWFRVPLLHFGFKSQSRFQNFFGIIFFLCFFCLIIVLRFQLPTAKSVYAILGFFLFFIVSILVTLQKKVKKQSYLSVFRKRDEWLYGILLGATFSLYLWF